MSRIAGMKTPISFVTSFLLFAAFGCGKESNDPPGPIRQLSPLLGTWSGIGSWFEAGEEFPLEAAWRCNSSPGGFAIICDLEVTGALPYRQVQIFSFEESTKRIHWMMSCDQGIVNDMSGNMDGDTLIVQSSQAIARMKFVSDRSIEIEIQYGPELNFGVHRYRFAK